MEHVGAFTQIWREICKFDDDGGRSFVTVEQVWLAQRYYVVPSRTYYLPR